MTMTIYFYAQTDEYSEFSNFAPFGVEMDDEWWRTVEHYFQAQKFLNPEYQSRIRKSSKPKDASAMGRTRDVPLRPDWETVKDQIMYDAVKKKFETHPEIRRLLLATGDQDIVENAPMDPYWGCGSDGTGLNKLGKILMRVREELQSGKQG